MSHLSSNIGSCNGSIRRLPDCPARLFGTYAKGQGLPGYDSKTGRPRDIPSSEHMPGPCLTAERDRRCLWTTPDEGNRKDSGSERRHGVVDELRSLLSEREQHSRRASLFHSRPFSGRHGRQQIGLARRREMHETRILRSSSESQVRSFVAWLRSCRVRGFTFIRSRTARRRDCSSVVENDRLH